MPDIALQSNIKAVAFASDTTKKYLQVEFVIDFLKKHLQDERKITKDAIAYLYIDYLIAKKGCIRRWDYNDQREWGNHKLSRDQAFKKWAIYSHSLTWFKNVLGLAIIKGKLLAIPVIDIE